MVTALEKAQATQATQAARAAQAARATQPTLTTQATQAAQTTQTTQPTLTTQTTQPTLTTRAAREPAASLWQSYLDDPCDASRNRLVMHYAGLVSGIVRHMISGHHSYAHLEDAVNEGIIALIDAVERFDPLKNVKFETYATIRVRGAVIDYFRRLDCFPRRLRGVAKTVRETEHALFMRLGRSPDDGEMAAALSLDIGEYRRTLGEIAALNILSFEEILYETSMGAWAREYEASSGSPAARMDEKELTEVLEAAVESLSEKERTVISLYYRKGLKIKEISTVLGVGPSRVSQMHSAAVLKLQRVLKTYAET